MEIYEEIRADRELGARRLVSEYRPRLEAAARMLCQDAHEAEDLVFRAFERAIERIDDFRPTGSFYYWVYTILLNFHRMDLRRRVSGRRRASGTGSSALRRRRSGTLPTADRGTRTCSTTTDASSPRLA